MASIYAGLALGFLSLAAAMPAPTPASTTGYITATPTESSYGYITLAPGFVMSETLINGKTYPILGGSVGVGYFLTATNLQLTGLVSLGLRNDYTVIDGRVYPVLDYTIAEADTEHITIPNILTFNDGGLGTSVKEVDVLITGQIGGATQIDVSGLAGVVTGALLGQPISLFGDTHLTLHLGSSIVVGATAAGVASIGNTGILGEGNVGVGAKIATDGLELNLGAAGTGALGPVTAGGTIGGGISIGPTKATASACIGVGLNSAGFTTCLQARDLQTPAPQV